MNLKEIVDRRHFEGLLVLPDIHDDIRALVDVIGFAMRENLFIVSLGDLNDGEEGQNPQFVTEAMLTLLNEGRAAFMNGNHDNKYYRYAKGNNVTLNEYNQATLDRTNGNEQYFLDLHLEIANHQNSGHYGYYDNVFFAHACSVKQMWEQEPMNRDHKSLIMHGMHTGERDANGYPVRIYPWVDEIPEGKMLFVGHDRSPFGHKINGGEPFINSNTNGSKVFFMDTGCGKGGHLTTAILSFTGDRLTFSKFQKF